MRPYSPPSLLPLGLALVCGLAPQARADDWPQWRGPTRDGRWRESGIVDSFSSAVLRPTWVAPVGPGFSGPTVAGDQVFLMDRVTTPTQQERVLSFDRHTGKARWTHAYACEYRDVDYALGPRAAVTIADGRAFSCGTMAHVRCLDATDGRLIWARNLAADFKKAVNFWGMNSPPLVIGDRVVFQIGGEPGACLVALDVRTGREVWRALDGGASYSPPRLIQFGNHEAVLAWTAQWLAVVDAKTGVELWKQPYTFSRMVHHVADPVLDETGRRVLLTAFYDGSHVFAIDAAAEAAALLWHRAGINERKTVALHSMVTTPFIRAGHVYGVDSYGETRCLNLATGDRVWEDTTLLTGARWATAHFVQNGDRTWVTTEHGDIVIARFTPRGAEVISRARFITPDTHINGREEPLTWSHPAYAHRSLFARTDSQLVCISLAAPSP